jgi:hypothetical protein
MTCVAGLRLTRVTAPWVPDGPMNGHACRTYFEHILAPTLKRGDVLMLDNLPALRSPLFVRQSRPDTPKSYQLLLKPGHEPDRDVLLRTQSVAAVTTGTHDRCFSQPHRHFAQSRPANRIRQLLSRSRRSTFNLKCSKLIADLREASKYGARVMRCTPKIVVSQF